MMEVMSSSSGASHDSNSRHRHRKPQDDHHKRALQSGHKPEGQRVKKHSTKRHAHTNESERPAVVRAASSAAVVLLGAAGVYSGIRGALQGYQHLRRRLLRQLIAEVCPVLDSLGVPYWADFGTLLGMYREKDVILHDNDADIVVLQPDWDLLALQLRERLPPHLKVYFVTPSEDESIRWLRVSVGGFGILDLYGGYDEGGENISIPQGHGELCDLPRKMVLPMERLHFRGYDVSVPRDVVGVLEFRYGKTFMVPRYMDKGRDSVEQGKLYARLLGLLGRTGLCV